MAVAAPEPPTQKQQRQIRRPQPGEKTWADFVNRSGYLIGAILLHVVVLAMVATAVIFPAFHPPEGEFTKTYLPPASSAPPPPPPPPTPQVSTTPANIPTPTITAQTAAPAFTIPMPDINPATTVNASQNAPPPKIVAKPNTISPERAAKIAQTEEQNWGRTKDNILNSNGDPRNIVAHFPVFLAKYANGDWGYGESIQGGQITIGALPNLVAKINEYSHGNITGEVVPTPLDIGGPDLLDKKPPFVFFTGHKDFTLTDQEIQNLRDYLQVGGCIWGDNSLPGYGSRFDVAFRREMKRVVPDEDKQFQPVPLSADIFVKSWFPLQAVPKGMNFYSEPVQHLDIDGKLAILYTPNDYNDMFSMRVLPGDTQMKRGGRKRGDDNPLDLLSSPEPLIRNQTIFFRNWSIPTCVACNQFGMNIIGYMLVRFDKDLLLAP
jgi:hypothetical protein